MLVFFAVGCWPLLVFGGWAAWLVAMLGSGADGLVELLLDCVVGFWAIAWMLAC